MGNKIITEKDFWICSSGAVPAQLQSTQSVSNKKTGEKYITVRDKTTSSFIDFGCTKYMLLMAIAAAILVVAAVVVGVITVATGGLGLIAIGALAGLAGGVLGAVVGSLLCGQKMATKRQWLMPKTNFKILEADTITGDCTMICPIGGIVQFAPNIKSWTQAIGLASLNYVTKLAECALSGAMVGAAAPAVAGLFTGTATLAMPTVASIGSNIAFTFTGFGGWMGAGRVLGGVDNVANEYALGHVNSAGDAAKSVIFGVIPEVGIAHRIVTTGQVHPSDALLLLYFLNIKAKTPVASDVEPNSTNEKESPTGDEGAKPPGTGEPEITEPEPGQDGEAYEDPANISTKSKEKTQGEPEDQLSDKGKNNPPLTPEELARVSAWQRIRNKFLKGWREQDLSKLPPNIKSKLTKALNSVRDHATPDDIAGSIKEKRGEQILDDNGEPFDHQQEVDSANKSLKNAIEELKEEMKNDPDNKELEPLLKDLSKLKDDLNKANQ